MDKRFLASVSENLQRQRRTLVQQVAGNEAGLDNISTTRESELEERAQEERTSTVVRHLEEREQDRLRDIDAALARIEAGVYGKCENCGRAIDKARLRANPTTTFCADCSAKLGDTRTEAPEEAAQGARLPPDLALLDDEELQEHLLELVREDGQVDTEELRIIARNGVIHLEGAVPSEEEQEVLLNILTDVAGVQEIVNTLEIRRLAWEREDRSKTESATDTQPDTIPKKEPYAGTGDPVLSDQEGITYEPPENPPPPPEREKK